MLYSVEKERNICGKKEHHNKGLYARTGGADTWDAPRSLKEILSKLQNDETFKSVDADTVRLLNACTNSNISISEGEEKMDMCLGLKELIEEGREEGILLTKKVYQLQRKGKSNDDIAKECDIEISQVMKILE